MPAGLSDSPCLPIAALFLATWHRLEWLRFSVSFVHILLSFFLGRPFPAAVLLDLTLLPDL
jgi:hypothetical protein